MINQITMLIQEY